jgi:hypothetical protein
MDFINDEQLRRDLEIPTLQSWEVEPLGEVSHERSVNLKSSLCLAEAIEL